MKYFKDLEHNDYHNIIDEESGDNQTNDTAQENVENVEESLKERRYAIRNLVWFIKLGSLDKSKRNTAIAIIAFNLIFILIAGVVIAAKCAQNNKARKEGESCGNYYCGSPPCHMGDCEDGLTCVYNRRVRDSPGSCKRPDEETNNLSWKFAVGSVRLPVMLFDQNHQKARQFKGILIAKTRKNNSNSTQTLKVDIDFVFAVKGQAGINPDVWDTTRLYLQRKVYKDKPIAVEGIEKGDIVEISDEDCIVVQSLAKDSNQITYMEYITLKNKELENTTAVHQLEDGQITNKELNITKDANVGFEKEQKTIVKEEKTALNTIIKEAKTALNADESEEDSAEKSSVEKVSEEGEQEQKTVDKVEKSTSDSEEDSEEMSSEEFNIEEVEEDIADVIAYIVV